MLSFKRNQAPIRKRVRERCGQPKKSQIVTLEIICLIRVEDWISKSKMRLTWMMM